MTKRIIAIANQKGGVGKTTTAVNLGAALTRQARSVLLVDCDPQGQVATFLGLRQESTLFDLLVSGRPLAEVIRSASRNNHDRPGLSVIPGDRRTATAQTVLASEGFRLQALGEALAPARADFLIFDTSPSVGLLQEAALFAADWLIVPSAVDYAATEGLMAILATLKAQQERGARCQLAGVVPTFFDEVTRESRATLEELRETFGDAVWPPIHRATILRECAAEGVTVFERDPIGRAAREYAELAERVLAHE